MLVDDSDESANSNESPELDLPLSNNYFPNEKIIVFFINYSFSLTTEDLNDSFIHEIIDLVNRYHIVPPQINSPIDKNTESTKSELTQIADTTTKVVTTESANAKQSVTEYTSIPTATSNEAAKPSSTE